MKLKLLYLACALSLLASCSDFLDVKPVGKLIPTEVEEFENILNNANTVDWHYMDNNKGTLLATLGDNLKISENIANYSYVSTHPNIDRFTAYTFRLPYRNPISPSYFWEYGYRSLGLLNNAIDGVESVRTPASDALANQVIAQAKAARAWAYLTMGQLFGPVYDPSGANSAKTVPYRTTGDASAANPPLATTAELFEKAKKDLEDAMLYAPQNTANPSRANLSAAQALMAYYYMFTRDFGKMYEYADLAWASALSVKGSVDNLIYDYNKFYYEPDPEASPTPGTDIEVNLDMKGPDDLMNETNHRENLFYRVCPGTDSYPSDEYLALFDSQMDTRYKLWFLRTLGYSTTVGGVKYDDGIVRKYYKSSKMKSNEGLTYPELLLMRAEAAARTNKMSVALEDLNTLRRYRYVNTVAGTTTDLENGGSLTQDQLLEEILKERRRELPIASFQRVLDLKRLSLDAGKPWCKTTVEHYIGNQQYSAPLNSEYFILPIPNNIIELNPAWGLQKDMRPYNPK